MDRWSGTEIAKMSSTSPRTLTSRVLVTLTPWRFAWSRLISLWNRRGRNGPRVSGPKFRKALRCSGSQKSRLLSLLALLLPLSRFLTLRQTSCLSPPSVVLLPGRACDKPFISVSVISFALFYSLSRYIAVLLSPALAALCFHLATNTLPYPCTRSIFAIALIPSPYYYRYLYFAYHLYHFLFPFRYHPPSLLIHPLRSPLLVPIC
ncbi:hypothetical protein BOTBODRAFT_579069 [Botryobasidium botryosum FD-172 SS1]|uniref:Uncharacterized protein n=1 Tax=Botryobasidium botryosum (strain FD-172 SS1) TaxID=930990 RepID=A0A067MSD5_BOTB1|nr:hypothetical protein BOTBODRAFT_579069 [Botryobasidium botryosum FD-172 SS1]